LQARDVRYEAGPGVAGEAWPRRINSRRRSRKAGENSSLLVRALDLIGDRWTFLVLREAFFGVRRFEDFHQNLGIARNILTSRLSLLVRNGIFEKRMYQKRPDRFEYRFTEKGLDLYAVPLTLMRWGDRWLAGKAGPPLVLFHKSCGYRTLPRITCSHCGLELKAATARGTDFGAIPPRT
jgi:DNA-binding HxlR family transcriptional regulator